MEKLADITLSINFFLSLSYSSTPTSSLDPYSPCNNNCECQTDSFTPVCGADGVTYLSACFAGCSSTVSGLSWGPPTCRSSSCVSGRAAHLHPAVTALPKADLTALVGLSPCCFSLCSINVHSLQQQLPGSPTEQDGISQPPALVFLLSTDQGM